MAVTAYDYDREAGGMTGTRTEAGVPIDTWNSWSAFNQDLFLQDYMRTDLQSNYYDDWCANNPTACAAYIGTAAIDSLTGLDAAEATDEGGWIDDASDALDDVKDDVIEIVETGKDITTAAIIVGAILLLRR
jgi:hypothetical protein